MEVAETQRLTVLSPLILTADLVLLLGGEVVLNVEGLADLLGGLSLDHIGDGFAADIKESFDIEIVCGKDDFKQHFLVHLHVLLVPLLDVGRLLARVGIVVVCGWWIALVVVAPLHDLLQDGLVDVGNWDRLGSSGLAQVVDQVLNEDGTAGNLTVNSDVDTVRGGECDSWSGRGSWSGHC